VLTNIGPPLVLGGIFPGQTLAGNFGVTLNVDHATGEGMNSLSVLLVPTPEPATLSLSLIGASLLLHAVRRRVSNMRHLWK
jgi:hypothetical protein